ncbi:MAG: hypothetical protein LBU61_02615 [Coriobacteriales bacterium]|jgi:hypothetical protein|nr:hypothetical protein [Coriobacteriales bacterium]
MDTDEKRELIGSISKMKKQCGRIRTYCQVSMVMLVLSVFFLYFFILLVGQFNLPVEIGVSEIIDLVLSVALCSTLLYTIFRIFADAAVSATPFTLKQAGRFRTIGWLIIIYSILDFAKALIVYILAFRDYIDFFYYHPNDPVPLMTLNTNIYVLLAGVVCLGLAYIFRYGVLLQQLSDDTL